MSVNFFSEDVPLPKIKYVVLKRIIGAEIESVGKKSRNLNYIFCSDEHLLSINKQFLNHDYYTDVITFDYCKKNIISGDIFISIDRVSNNSEIYEQNFISELVRVIFHGSLHLIGFNDKTSDEITLMRKKEDDLIENYFRLIS